MATALIQPPPPFIPGANPAQEWEDWRSAYELYEEACEYTTKKDGPRRALLLHVLGATARKTYKGFIFPPPTTARPHETSTEILNKFGDLYKPYKNVTHASAMFNTIIQKPGQTIDELVAELRIQGNDCDYGDKLDRMVGDRLIVGINDGALKERLLRETTLTLDKIINMCKSAEISKTQIKSLHSTATTNSTVDNLNYKKTYGNGYNKNKFHGASTNKNYAHNSEQQRRPKFTKPIQRTCTRCGTNHKPKSCPAYGSNCNNCGKFGHFAKVCKQKKFSNSDRQVAALSGQDDSSEEFFIGELTVNSLQQNSKWLHTLNVEGYNVIFKLDSGSEVNILPSTIFSNWNIKPQLIPTTCRITTYSGDKLKIAGECKLHCSTNKKTGYYRFFIINGNYKPILGAMACEDMGLIMRQQINDAAISTLVNTPNLNSPEAILEAFPDVFDGIGKLPGTYKITIQPNATPKIAAPRRIPQALETPVKNELKRMEAAGIIIKVTEPTQWVHPVVVARKKNGNIRICLDPRQLNEVIMREHYRIPTQEELFAKLSGCQLFSLFDASDAFWQLELDKESSLLCTFATQWGRYRFLRMPFGVNCAPEQFQRAMDEIFQGKSFFPYFDDILLAAKTKEQQNDQIFQLLTLARLKGLKLNKNKIKIGQKSITYLGHVLTHNGITPDPTKITAITAMMPPTNTIELMRFMGMITYLTKFVPSFSHKTNQLRSLLKTNTPWVWDENMAAEFAQIKLSLTSAPVLRYFNINERSVISTDASSYGLGSVLLQNRQPIAYASATLTETQKGWAQIEKELLAIVFACERFHNYIYGTNIDIHTDHKPLLGLINKPLEKVTPRLQRLLLRLQKYDVTLQYVPGKLLNVADTLSRAPTSRLAVTQDISDDVTVCNIVTVKATTPKLNQIRTETLADETLKLVAEYIRKGWPPLKKIKDENLRGYHHCKNELHIVDDFICRGQRLVIPKAEQQDALEKLHIAHRGIVSCKNKARQTIYWPSMNDEIEVMIKTCVICQQHQNNNQREPIEDRELPTRPWQKLALDFLYVKGLNYLLLVDYFSKYVEVQPMKTTTARGVIAALKAVFARFGLPDELISDNGPPMDSKEFKTFLEQWDINYNPSAPYNPRSNGLAERSVQTLKKSLIKAAEDDKDLYTVLLDHRNTPMDGLRSPAELLMGRKIRTLVPILPDNLNPHYEHKDTQNQLKVRQSRQHLHGDRHTKPLTPLSLGQEVWFALNKGWQPGKIAKVGPQKRSYIIRGQSGTTYRRNRYHIKPAYYDLKPIKNLTPNRTVKTTPEDFYQTHVTDVAQTPETMDNVPMTRSGRRIILPARFKI